MDPITIPASEIRPDDILCNIVGTPFAHVATIIGDEEVGVWVSAYSLDRGCWFPVTFDVGEEAIIIRERLAVTGRPSKAPVRAAATVAGVATALALSVVLSTNTDQPAPTMTPAPYFSRSSSGVQPYRPTVGPRPTPHTTRAGKRKALAKETVAHPSTTPTKPHPIATPPADIRISFYTDCTGHAQECIDAGTLTMYAGNILAGHNFDGYQWLSRVPVGRTVHIIRGPLAGSYEVYGHQRLNRQGGSIPDFDGAPDLVLQTCEGSGTGFTLLRRVT
ncbi:hypothetical protein [Streptomyces sp. NTK 937]|uniref:hypothetical protein n=1 Tax=Streptomyces sp. NTK 937 TaxID=1487711 RepID=UPI0004A8D90A|nr:hypothetical protein [Streptomyces sp. NTK 937]KDQ65665.1 hypothetical protein DT87_32855 [Streptomyces sp. NTK 937]KDQ65703.1 hypothetical protein DT87_00145 [Streptomyces sp. NTK 937]